MIKNTLRSIGMVIVIFFTFISFAPAQTLQMPMHGKHAQLGLSCAACHGTDTPERKAPQSACRNCHGDKTQDAAITFKEAGGREVTVNPHASHAGDLRCTLCHQMHEPSKLYCNEACHHTFDLKVP